MNNLRTIYWKLNTNLITKKKQKKKSRNSGIQNQNKNKKIKIKIKAKTVPPFNLYQKHYNAYLFAKNC